MKTAANHSWDESRLSWGRYPRAKHKVQPVVWPSDGVDFDRIEGAVLPYGLGRSYGDCCLNDRQSLLLTRPMRRFISFDPEGGILRCEAGTSLAEVLKTAVPKGWFPPVTPGTRFVTVGGAIANDIHGKNHHSAGTFGRYVRRFELLRSDGSRLVCSPEENPGMFRATIGGLGLTGLILWAEIQLRPIGGPWIEKKSVRFARLEGFFELSARWDPLFEYTVAWVDAFSKKGRGIYMAGNHSDDARNGVGKLPKRFVTLPCEAPNSLINPLSMRVFNSLYFRFQLGSERQSKIHYSSFFYPLDAIGDWNLAYGRRGFLQYQFAVPVEAGKKGILRIWKEIHEAGLGSFLSVLKRFGDSPSPGLLSFPLPGYTLALDFPLAGERLFSLLDRLDGIVADLGGRVYPAKDARMSATRFKQFFPNWEELAACRDPRFSSSFWRRAAEAGG